MGTILLNSSELKQYAKQVSQLLTELNSMQTDIKASVNELDSSSTGKSAKHASDVMFDCYGKGQKASAGITEISAIVSNAVSLFTELDSRVGNNMAEIYTDPEHSKAFFSKEQANVKTEVKSDFVELKKNAKSTESDTFKPEQPKSLWETLTEDPIAVAATALAAGVIICLAATPVALIVGGVVIAFALSDLVEGVAKEGFGKEEGYNPLKNIESGILGGVGTIGGGIVGIYKAYNGDGNYKEEMVKNAEAGYSKGSKIGNGMYGVEDGIVGVVAIVADPEAAVTKTGEAIKAFQVVEDVQKTGKIASVMERAKSAGNVIREGSSKILDGDWKGVHLGEAKTALKDIPASIKNLASGIKGSGEQLRQTISKATKPINLQNDFQGIGASYKSFMEDVYGTKN